LLLAQLPGVLFRHYDRELRTHQIANATAGAFFFFGNERNVVALAIESIGVIENVRRTELDADIATLAQFAVDRDTPGAFFASFLCAQVSPVGTMMILDLVQSNIKSQI